MTKTINNTEENLINLPPKWKAIKNDVVGFDFIDEKGKISLQHPKDNNAIRKFCWAIYNKIEDK